MNQYNREQEAKVSNAEAQTDLTWAHVARVKAETIWFHAKSACLVVAVVVGAVYLGIK